MTLKHFRSNVKTGMIMCSNGECNYQNLLVINVHMSKEDAIRNYKKSPDKLKCIMCEWMLDFEKLEFPFEGLE